MDLLCCVGEDILCLTQQRKHFLESFDIHYPERYDIYFNVSIWLLYFKADFNSLWTGSYYKTWTPLKIYIELNLTLPWRKSAKSNNLYIIFILWWFNLRHLNIIIETKWHYIYKSVLLSETDQIYTLKCIKWSIPCQQN